MPSLRFKIDDIVAPEARQSAEDHLECSVCLSILSDPVQTPCQHVFCSGCIAPCLACPNCNASLPAEKTKKGTPLSDCNKFAHGMLQKLRVGVCFSVVQAQQGRGFYVSYTVVLSFSEWET